MDLEDDVKFVKGVGPNRVKLLNKLNISTIYIFKSLFCFNLFIIKRLLSHSLLYSSFIFFVEASSLFILYE